MKYIKLFEGFINENNQKKIETAADAWWNSLMEEPEHKHNKGWDAEDMDMFIDHLMELGLVSYDDNDLDEVRSDMEQYVENTLGFEFDYDN